MLYWSMTKCIKTRSTSTTVRYNTSSNLRPHDFLETGRTGLVQKERKHTARFYMDYECNERIASEGATEHDDYQEDSDCTDSLAHRITTYNCLSDSTFGCGTFQKSSPKQPVCEL